MQYACGHEPAGPWRKAVGPGEVGDVVVPLGPSLQAMAHLCWGCAGFESEVGVWELGPVIIELGREEVSFRFVLHANESGMLLHLVQVKRQGTAIIKELGVDGPPTVS